MRSLATAWRLWAALPAEVRGLIVEGPAAPGRVQIRTVPRPELPAGVCAACGCTHEDPCIDAIGECCAWTDRGRQLCTFCRGGVQRRQPGGLRLLSVRLPIPDPFSRQVRGRRARR